MNNRLANNSTVQHAVITVLLGVAIVIGGWWQIEAQVDKQIDKKVGPVSAKLDDVRKKVDANTAAVNQNNGMLRGISQRLLVEVPPPLPPPPPK
jgi:hypothetical protein